MKSMDASRIFLPPRRTGTIFHLVVIAGLSAGAGWAVWRTSQVQSISELIPYLAILGFFLTATPVILYRLYALHRSHYRLERGSLHLQWGWRQETLPFDQIQWIHPFENLENPPRPPLFHWPGAVIGTRKPAPGVAIEFLASGIQQPLMIATPDAYYVINPADPAEFTAAYQQFIEWGTLSAPDRKSEKPAVLLTDVRRQKLAVGMLLAGLILSISLLTWVLILIPGRQEISLGFTPAGIPHQPLQSVRLVLLPILNFSSYLANFLLGLFLYRREDHRIYAYLLWITSPLVGLIFHIGLFLILR